MADKSSGLVQGTLNMLILKTLDLEPMHGYGISARTEQMSKGEWKATENSRPAKYYVLTEQGRKRLNNETREWGRQVAAIVRILEAS